MSSPFELRFGALPLVLGTLAAAQPALAQEAPGVGDGSLWVLSLEHDAVAHRAALEDLALWRRAGEPTGFAQRLKLVTEAQASRAASVAAVAGALDVEVLSSTWLTPSLGVWIESESELAALRDHPLVSGAQRVGERGPNQAQANSAHNIPAAHALTQNGGLPIVGTGVTVALLDSGLDTDVGGAGRPHAAYYADGNPSSSGPGLGGSRILSSYSEDLGLVGCSDPEDTTGHGSRMGAILAGAQWSSLPDSADGAAPDAWLRSYKITDCNTSNASTITMDFALGLAVAEPDVRVVNLSYDGTSTPGYHLNQAMDAAEQAGVLVVVSAGNSGEAQSFMHGKYGGLSVGASFAGQAQPYVFPGFQTSAIGPLPDGRRYPNMLAVGEKITTVALDNEAGTQDSYGSSGAAALTSGSAALALQARPSLGPLALKALILNTLAPVVAGDSDASGLGFLDTEALVQGALAGDVADGSITPGFEQRFPVIAVGGQPFTATLTWSREDVLNDEVDDLDLELRQFDGTLIASSRAVLDNVEQVQQTFDQTTALQLVVRVAAATSGPIVDFGLAATNFGSGGSSFAPDDLTATAPSIDVVAPQGIPSSGAYARFFVKGTGMEQVTGVDVGGVAASFTFESPGRLRVDVPLGIAPGLQTVDLVAPGGTDSSTVVVGVTAPELTAFVNFVDSIFWDLDGSANAAYGLFLSTSPTPTDLPGVVQLAIGNQGTSLFLVDSGLFNPFGESAGQINGGATLPNGTEILLQAVEFDLITLSLIPSNVVKSLKAIHFG